MDRIKNKEHGITLIALVVTIIILLILAGVTVGLATNGTGLFEKAKLAADKYNNAVQEEEIEVGKAKNSIDNYIDGNRNNVTEDVLWEGTGTNGCEILLSQPLSNYKFIEIYFVNKDLGVASGVPAPILKYDVSKIIQAQQFYIYDSNRTWGYTSKYEYNPTTNKLKNTSNQYYGSSTNTNSIYYLEVYKIIGMK